MYLVKHAIVLVVATVLIAPDHVRAERVGFSFQGNLQQIGPAGNYTIFGISVPKTSPVTGTFSYDTTTPGVDGDPGVRTYHQEIQGGYTLNINNGAIRLAASDYIVTVANDFVRTPENVDIFSVDFDSRFVPAPDPIIVNGAPFWRADRFYQGRAELARRHVHRRGCSRSLLRIGRSRRGLGFSPR